MNILISSLGLNVDIVEEAIGLFNNENFDFYKDKSKYDEVCKMRDRLHLEQVNEVWLAATNKQHIGNYTSSFEDFETLKGKEGIYNVKFRLFLLEDVQDIYSVSDARAYHDMVLRIAAYAHSIKGESGKVYMSLACGRKTMSADIQDAAYSFGCNLLFHILGDKESPILPISLGSIIKNETLHLDSSEVDINKNNEEIVRIAKSDNILTKIEIQKESSQHFYTSLFLEQGETDTFRVLYTLPKDKINKLKEERIGTDPNLQERDLDFLRMLPKTELHCHLGGVLSPKEMIEVAKCYIPEIQKKKDKNSKYAKWYEDLNCIDIKSEERKEWKSWAQGIANNLGVHRSMVVAPYLLRFEEHPEVLESLIYEGYDSELDFVKIGIKAYEALGDLQGSALLSNEDALRKTVNILLENCRKENVKYLEIRCSPLNYVVGQFTDSKVMDAILEEIDKEKEIKCSVILIASRHGDLEKIKECVDFAGTTMRNHKLFKKYFRGFDLAGDEKAKSPEEVRPHFLNAMKECYNITIHAGETANVENVWQAVYVLNAERVGHGLTLTDNEGLMKKFLDRKIGIEMCPSSNYQIVGAKDNYNSDKTDKYGDYPLKKYMDMGLKVSINTDDPGISRTDITREYLKAARMVNEGLSKWEILKLIHNGFHSAFLPYKEKKELFNKIEKYLGNLIIENKL